MSAALVVQDPFAPLEGPNEVSQDKADQPRPILPVAVGAPPPLHRHSRLGEPSSVWSYLDASGRLLGGVARFDKPDGKQILPLTWCRLPDGSEGWRWKSFPTPRPLYGLHRLAARPEAPVLVVEGEKTADAAACRFPDYVVVTWPGGSNAVAKADWSPLAGRTVAIWPDADEPGVHAAEAVARAALAADARSAALVQLVAALPSGWDLADPVPDGLDLAELLGSAKPVSRQPDLPAGYAFTRRGLIHQGTGDSDPEVLVCGPIEVLAETRDAEGESWGVLVSWLDHDGRQHRVALPRAALAGDGAEARRVLLDGGLYVAPGRRARELLTAFLVAVRSSNRVTATGQIGWHGLAFVLPSQSFGTGAGEDVLLQGHGAIEHQFRQCGTLENWQEQVAHYAVGNSRLAMAISAAFGAVLLKPCDAESGGIHLRGPSSTGKSTALVVAGSVWGGGASGYIRSWRATSNGLEGVALGHCDALLCLDELSQLSAREAGEVAYMLANGSGKSRSTREGAARRAARWRTLFLSSGEIGLADKIAEDGRGRRSAAGQQVRIVDVPADAGSGLGVFEDLHGFVNADSFARHLKASSTACYGTAINAFLDRIVQDQEAIRSAALAHIRQFIASHVPENADGQVQRVAHRFGLVAAGGELAVAAGVLLWQQGEATHAAARCFSDWLSARGGTEAAEIRDGIAQVRRFLLANGQARFLPAWEDKADHTLIRDLAGFRRREDSGWDYLVTSDAWTEVCAGLDCKALARTMAERGLLVGATARHRATSVTVPGHGKRRLYHVPARFLEESGDE